MTLSARFSLQDSYPEDSPLWSADCDVSGFDNIIALLQNVAANVSFTGVIVQVCSVQCKKVLKTDNNLRSA